MCTTSATSSTMRTMVARLMPKASSPISASPDSFSKMRLWAGRASGMDGSPWMCGGCECNVVEAATPLRHALGRSDGRQASGAGLAAATCAATSAAKSSTFFSMPSPTTYSVKPLTLVLAALSICSTVCLSFFTNGWL